MAADVSSRLEMSHGPFKDCPKCAYRWESRDNFLMDPAVALIGYQANFRELQEGLFLFSHSCRGILAIRVGGFSDLYEGTIFSRRAIGSYECPDFCRRKDELKPCTVKCECAYIRETMQIVGNWRKNHLT